MVMNQLKQVNDFLEAVESLGITLLRAKKFTVFSYKSDSQKVYVGSIWPLGTDGVGAAAIGEKLIFKLIQQQVVLRDRQTMSH